MKIEDIYQRPGLTFSVEFFPPKTEQGERNLFRELEILRTLRPAFCSVTYGAGGSTRDQTVDLVARISDECGLEVMCHLTVVDQSREQVRAVLDKLRGHGIHNIIALAGDPPRGAEGWAPHPDGFHHSRELVVEALRQDWFSVAVAGFPEVHPRAENREADLRYLKQKVDAGACAVITQLFFDNEDYFRFVEDARRVGIDVPIVPGMLPVLSAGQIRRFTELCGSRIPPRLDALLEKVADDDEGAVELGIDYTTEQCEGLLEFGIPGIHFYSLNRSRSVAEVFDRLSLASLA